MKALWIWRNWRLENHFTLKGRFIFKTTHILSHRVSFPSSIILYLFRSAMKFNNNLFLILWFQADLSKLCLWKYTETGQIRRITKCTWCIQFSKEQGNWKCNERLENKFFCCEDRPRSTIDVNRRNESTFDKIKLSSLNRQAVRNWNGFRKCILHILSRLVFGRQVDSLSL